MKTRRTYIAPETAVVDVELQQMIAFSGDGDVVTSPEEDMSDYDNRSRQSSQWDFDDEDEY